MAKSWAPRFESQVLCSTCPVTLGRALTLSQPWGPFLQNADPNWTHIGGQGFGGGGSFCPVWGTFDFCFCVTLTRPRLSPSLSFSSGIRGCRWRPPGLWELNVDEMCVGPGLGPWEKLLSIFSQCGRVRRTVLVMGKNITSGGTVWARIQALGLLPPVSNGGDDALMASIH